jgi:hypothetical protein
MMTSAAALSVEAPVEAPTSKEPLALLTQSRLACARACQRLHRIKYEQGYRAQHDTGARHFGTLVHLGLERWWHAKMIGGDHEAQLRAALAAVQQEADAYTKALAEVMLTAYHHRWKDEPYEVLAVEIQFVTELRNPQTGAASRTWKLAGKLDVVVRDLRDGNVKFIEHKTSSEDITPGSIYWRRLRMDTQVSVYFAGAASLAFDATECVYDVLGKPGQRPSKVALVEDGANVVLGANGERVRTKDGKKWRETADASQGYVLQTRPETPEEYAARLTEAIAADPDRYFARGSVVRIGDEMDHAMADIWDTAKQIQEAKIAGRAPRNPSACMQYGRACDFIDVCSGMASLDDTTLFTRSDDVHPELIRE